MEPRICSKVCGSEVTGGCKDTQCKNAHKLRNIKAVAYRKKDDLEVNMCGECLAEFQEQQGDALNTPEAMRDLFDLDLLRWIILYVV